MEILFIIIQIIILDGILSIDNAAALAAIASKLPRRKPPLPSWLSWLGRTQPQAALKAGIFGAYLGRGLMLFITGIIIQYSFLKLVGAGYLLYLVWDHFKPNQGGEEDNRFSKNAGNFWKTIVLIEFADLAFSLDNVVAVVALSQNIWIVIVGVFISILIMRFAAQLFIKLIKWEPLLEHAAYVLILAIAVELILKYFGFQISEVWQFGISMLIIAGFIFIGQIRKGGYK